MTKIPLASKNVQASIRRIELGRVKLHPWQGLSFHERSLIENSRGVHLKSIAKNHIKLKQLLEGAVVVACSLLDKSGKSVRGNFQILSGYYVVNILSCLPRKSRANLSLLILRLDNLSDDQKRALIRTDIASSKFRPALSFKDIRPPNGTQIEPEPLYQDLLKGLCYE